MQHFSSERTVRAKNEWIRPQHRPLQAVTKRGVALPGGWAEPRPGYSASPVAESTRTHSVFLGWLPWRPKAGMGQKGFLAQTLLWGEVKTEPRDSDFLLTKWNLAVHCGKLQGLNWRKEGSEFRPHKLGLPRGHLPLQQWGSHLKKTLEAQPGEAGRVSNMESPKQMLEAQWYP